MARDDANFLARWSRLKREETAKPGVSPDPKPAAQPPPAPVQPPLAAPQLPPLESLTPESDYRAFLQPDVSADLRRAALKKLFSDPHFRFEQMDKLNTYIDDYTQFDPIPDEMLKTLDHARQTLFPEEKAAADADAAAQSAAALQPSAAAPAAPPDAPQSVAGKPKVENADPGQDA